ncbi:hypothetical protein QWJ26_24665 [Streptomyces sp. CSDS2]|uniref:hypothetical protein n=1 Tax=Streptomyces sp. CSDS2 TaxID=3055051 RepID=UPI0025B02FD3|nr:hypothetical protein [Streptomyces sp. CSDS2]MDN3262942.1 hypothetical protein [Streptomyces sp. CSDS2]
MNTRITAVIFAAAALTLTACSGPGHADGPGGGEHASNAGTPKASPTPSIDWSAAAKAAGIPPEPTGAERAELLRALAAANPDIVKYEEKAIDAARNQCKSLNDTGVTRLDWMASQRFTYKDVTTTEAQGKQINEALRGIGFCKV